MHFKLSSLTHCWVQAKAPLPDLRCWTFEYVVVASDVLHLNLNLNLNIRLTWDVEHFVVASFSQFVDHKSWKQDSVYKSTVAVAVASGLLHSAPHLKLRCQVCRTTGYWNWSLDTTNIVHPSKQTVNLQFCCPYIDQINSTSVKW